MGLFSWLLPGVGALVGGVANAFDDKSQERELEAIRAEYSPFTGRQPRQVEQEKSPFKGALEGGYLGLETGMSLDNTISKSSRKDKIGSLLDEKLASGDYKSALELSKLLKNL